MVGGLFAWSIYSGERYYTKADSVEGFVWNTLTGALALLAVLSIAIWYSLRKVKRNAIVDNNPSHYAQPEKSLYDEDSECESDEEGIPVDFYEEE